MLVAALALMLLFTACIDEDDPKSAAPGPPSAGENGDDEGVGGELVTRTTDTPVVDPCAAAVPAVAVDDGTRQTIVGTVANVREVLGEDGDPTVLLEMGEQGGDVPFAVAIPAARTEQFARTPDSYQGEDICVTGVPQDFLGTPTIFINEESELSVVEQQ